MSLRRIPKKFYSVRVTNPRRPGSDSDFRYINGFGGRTGVGGSDTAEAFYHPSGVALISVNYLIGYVVLELYEDQDGPSDTHYVPPERVSEVFGQSIQNKSVKDLALGLSKDLRITR